MTNSIDSYVDGAIPRLTERRGEPASTGPGARRADTETAASGDLLDLTGRAQTLKALEQDLARTPEFDAARVGEIKDAVASGRYEVNAQRVAEKLLAMESKLP